MASAPPTPRLERRSHPLDFFAGLALPFTAARLILRSRRLLLLSALASAVTLAALVGLVAALWRYTRPLLAWTWPMPEPWYGQALWYGVLALTFVVLFVVGANTLPVLALAPLQDPLSEATEELCGDFRPAPFSLRTTLRQTLVSLGHTLARIGLLLLGHLGLVALNLVPGAGNAAWTVAATLWTMGWLAAEYLDAPMARHLYPFRLVHRMVWERLPLCLGFGAAIYILLWIPLLNACFIPVAVVSGTLLFRGLRSCGCLPAPGAPPA